MSLTWRNAFLIEAYSDYKLFQWLSLPENPANAEVCHRLHYLQMATEKLAKGFQTGVNVTDAPRFVHPAFTSFVRKNAKRVPGLREACHRSSQQAFNSYLKSLEGISQWIESLVPVGGEAGKRAMNPEYPWIARTAASQHASSPREIIQAPAKYTYPEMHKFGNKFGELIKFLASCFQIVANEIGGSL